MYIQMIERINYILTIFTSYLDHFILMSVLSINFFTNIIYSYANICNALNLSLSFIARVTAFCI